MGIEMLIKFEERNSPLIATDQGNAHIVGIDISNTWVEIDGCKEYPTEKDTITWVRLTYCVVGDEWKSGNFYCGSFQLSFISRILKDFNITAKTTKIKA